MSGADGPSRPAGEGWIEASRPLRESTPVWPGDHPFELDQRRESGCALTTIATTCHAATHLDAPLHLDPSGAPVEAVPLDRLVGGAEVVYLPVSGRALTPEDLEPGWMPETARVLVRTDSYPADGPIDGQFAGLSAELVHWLADRGVVLVGIDTPSVDHFAASDLPAHRALLARGMTWIEGLWLGGVRPGSYDLVALPMLIEGADAAPVRAILRRSCEL